MAASKPTHQWETAQHTAFRRAQLPADFRDQPRAEAFDLRFSDGRLGEAVLGLERQRVDAVAASDPELVFAVKAWLIARGQRRIALDCAPARGATHTLASGPIDPADLQTAPAAPAKRLVTLCPSNAEMVHALGAFDRVIACEDSSDYPREVAALPRLGPDLGPDLDRVAALRPDLVVSSLSVPGMERNVTGLQRRGIAQLVLAPRNLEDVLRECERTGTALGLPGATDRLIASMRQQASALEARRPAQRARVYLEWWPKPMFTPGADCFSNELIALAGGENVFGNRPGSSLQIDVAQLAAADPDVCFVSWCGVALDKLDPENLRKRPGLENLRAAQENRVFALDERFSGRPGPRMLQAARLMSDAIAAAAS